MTHRSALRLLFLLSGPVLFGAEPVPVVTQAAVWKPSETVLKAIHNACQKPAEQSVGLCLAGEMKKDGASPEALQFLQAMNDEAYLSRFVRAGGPDIAYVYYPFRANTLDGCFLVNTKSKWVDLAVPPDSLKVELQNNSVYRGILSAHPNATLWPGDRGDVRAVKVGNSGPSKHFSAEYSLRECHACEGLATVWIRYDFDRKAAFRGAHVDRVVKPQP